MTNYLAYLLAARFRELTLLQSQQAAMDQLLLEAHAEISNYLSRAAHDMESPIKVSRMLEVQAQIEGMMDGVINQIRDDMMKNLTVSAKYAVDGRVLSGRALLNDIMPEKAFLAPRVFATVNADAVRAVISRLAGAQTLSERIWELRKFTQDAIAKTLARGIIQGKSAYVLSRELEGFLKLRGKAYKTFDQRMSSMYSPSWKQAWRKQGSLSYNAYRLARTEINNAYREASIMSAERAPWVDGLKWNLSASHSKPDICDVWATQDIDGLGAGCYLPRNTPVDHPNGICYVTDVIAPPEVARQRIMDYALGSEQIAA